jgi:hypothetical protein
LNSETDFEFTIESFGQLAPKEKFDEAIKIEAKIAKKNSDKVGIFFAK